MAVDGLEFAANVPANVWAAKGIFQAAVMERTNRAVALAPATAFSL
jgi:hypothetical protein